VLWFWFWQHTSPSAYPPYHPCFALPSLCCNTHPQLEDLGRSSDAKDSQPLSVSPPPFYSSTSSPPNNWQRAWAAASV
jgi:hypothetical protein